jgi:hypothetical protein
MHTFTTFAASGSCKIGSVSRCAPLTEKGRSELKPFVDGLRRRWVCTLKKTESSESKMRSVGSTSKPADAKKVVEMDTSRSWSSGVLGSEA